MQVYERQSAKQTLAEKARSAELLLNIFFLIYPYFVSPNILGCGIS
jgi:hypothetical protein